MKRRAVKAKPESCLNCRFAGNVVESLAGDWVMCRRFPPPESGFTNMPPDSWCGEWKAAQP